MNKVQHVKNVLNSFENLTGRTIIKRTTPEADLLEIENGEFFLVSHNKEDDPVLNYGNKNALKLWELSWDNFIKTPSRKTAEADLRIKRKEMLNTVSKQGYFEKYEGIRVSSKGKRFKIKNVVIWNVKDENGLYLGQAAYFNTIESL